MILSLSSCVYCFLFTSGKFCTLSSRKFVICGTHSFSFLISVRIPLGHVLLFFIYSIFFCFFCRISWTVSYVAGVFWFPRPMWWYSLRSSALFLQPYFRVKPLKFDLKESKSIDQKLLKMITSPTYSLNVGMELAPRNRLDNCILIRMLF